MLTQNEPSLHAPLTEKELEELRRANRNLFIRNWLNGIFMLIAVLAMAGLLLFSGSENGTKACFALGLLAVLIKMVEVVMRMPGLKK